MCLETDRAVVDCFFSPTVQIMQCNAALHPPLNVQLEALYSDAKVSVQGRHKLVIRPSDAEGDKNCSHDAAEEDNVRSGHLERQRGGSR
jgi:hypothetical protein